MIITFDEPVDGFTHASVNSETRVAAAMVRLDVTYGTMGGGEFVPSSLNVSGQLMLNGAEMVDFIAEVKKSPGRPADKPDEEYESADVRAYLGTPEAERRARIEAREAAWRENVTP